MNVRALAMLLAVGMAGSVGLMLVILAGFLDDAAGRARYGVIAWLRGLRRFCPVTVTVRTRKPER